MHEEELPCPEKIKNKIIGLFLTALMQGACSPQHRIINLRLDLRCDSMQESQLFAPTKLKTTLKRSSLARLMHAARAPVDITMVKGTMTGGNAALLCPHVRAALRRYREKQPVLGWDNNGRLREHSLPPLLFLIDSKHAEEIQMIFRQFWAALTACSTKRPIINPGLTFTVRIDGRIPYSSILCLILGTNNVKRAAKRSSSAESMHAGTRNRHLEM